MKFVNTNLHHVYVDDGTAKLAMLRPGETVDATGVLADNLDETAGVVRAGSDAAKTYNSERELRELATAGPGPKAFPAEATAERSGLHITGRDSGVPVASDLEPGDTKDGSGKDKSKGIAAVQDGDVTRGDKPLAETKKGVAPDESHTEQSTTEKSEAVADTADTGTVTTEDLPTPDNVEPVKQKQKRKRSASKSGSKSRSRSKSGSKKS